MQVRVIAFGELTEILGKELLVDLPNGSDLSTLLSMLESKSGSEEGYLGGFRVEYDIAILVNGRSSRFLEGMETRLVDGDAVYLLLPFAGG